MFELLCLQFPALPKVRLEEPVRFFVVGPKPTVAKSPNSVYDIEAACKYRGFPK
jgi:hypothetical protein